PAMTLVPRAAGAGSRSADRARCAPRRPSTTASRPLERRAVDRLFDTSQEGLAQLAERELRLDAAHVDRSDRLLDAPDDRDFAERHDPTLVLRTLRRTLRCTSRLALRRAG